ncbi:hypothetical protein GCM10009727_17100 [Actinomadura napierensis]|uniref:Uncharacterized protein n=1 Tax=Actinomadura napierensis TaxID=267854 RepID=A0ABP5K6E8_9ACTN
MPKPPKTTATTFEQASPTFEARHMWMAGLSDEAAFDQMAGGYDLRPLVSEMSVPWLARRPCRRGVPPRHRSRLPLDEAMASSLLKRGRPAPVCTRRRSRTEA